MFTVTAKRRDYDSRKDLICVQVENVLSLEKLVWLYELCDLIEAFQIYDNVSQITDLKSSFGRMMNCEMISKLVIDFTLDS